jgi:hypothetical protein
MPEPASAIGNQLTPLTAAFSLLLKGFAASIEVTS